ncbi:MAG: hypothetical protein H6680_04930 [Desulfobacteraceae bacterium]|nr:hypothetical protein [Desulfobacteraceae bacterium]
MNIYENLFTAFKGLAQEKTIEKIVTGNSYTAVKLKDSSIGISYTMGSFVSKKSNYYSEITTLDILSLITGNSSYDKTVSMALINALNFTECLKMPEDNKNSGLLNQIVFNENTKVSMAGFIKPLAEKIMCKAKNIDVLDYGKNIGSEKDFFRNLKSADYLILTSTSLLNSSFQKIMDESGENTEIFLTGPTTPMAKEAFKETRVSFLAGSHFIPQYEEQLIENISLGFGTPVLKKFLRKIFLKL